MKNVVSIFLTISLLGTEAIARTTAPNHCEDLAAITCTPGQRDDGTGSANFVNPITFVQQEMRENRPELVRDFTRLLRGSEGSYLRNLGINAFGLLQNPACENKSSPACTSLVAEKLSDLYFLAEFGAQIADQPITQNLNSRDLLLIVGNGEYRATARNFAKRNDGRLSADLTRRVERQIFPNVLRLLKERVRALPVDERTKEFMISKLDNVRYSGANCSDGNPQSSGLAQALVPNAFYNPQTNEFSFCRAYFRFSTSEFAIAQTIAHELSHAIDPCGIASGPTGVAPQSPPNVTEEQLDNSYLRENFLACLRSERSAGARRTFGSDLLNSLTAPSPTSSPVTLVPAPSSTPTATPGSSDPNTNSYGMGYGMSQISTPAFCMMDTVTEAVPDWFAAEVMGEYVQRHLSHLSRQQMRDGISNMMRLSCGVESLERQAVSTHPPTRSRINGIIAVQPQLRRAMGCSASNSRYSYCNIDNPAALQAVVGGRSAPSPTPTAAPTEGSGTNR